MFKDGVCRASEYEAGRGYRARDTGQRRRGGKRCVRGKGEA